VHAPRATRRAPVVIFRYVKPGGVRAHLLRCVLTADRKLKVFTVASTVGFEEVVRGSDRPKKTKTKKKKEKEKNQSQEEGDDDEDHGNLGDHAGFRYGHHAAGDLRHLGHLGHLGGVASAPVAGSQRPESAFFTASPKGVALGDARVRCRLSGV